MKQQKSDVQLKEKCDLAGYILIATKGSDQCGSLMYHIQQCVSWGQQSNESINTTFLCSRVIFQHKHQHCSFKKPETVPQTHLELLWVINYSRVMQYRSRILPHQGPHWFSAKMQVHKLIFALFVKLPWQRKRNCLLSWNHPLSIK